MLKLIFLVLFFAVPSAYADDVKGSISHYVDGDTFVVDGSKIRLWGINTPEKSEAGYKKSKIFLQKLTADNTIVCHPRYTDYFKRTVADCEINGKDIAKTMVLSGMAKDYTVYSDGYYLSDENQARLEARGLWKSAWRR